jgi:hypothetical protein
MKRVVIGAILAVIIAGMAFGCTERERAGYSSIPQNSPSSWEINPYEGRIRN